MHYVSRLYDFLRRLAANNDRAWFQANRAEYDELRALWAEDIDRIIRRMTLWEPAMATQTARTAAYRINRDIRFSPDKSPYKTFFSAAFSPFGRKSERAGYYLEMSPFAERHPGVYGGLWCVDRPVLNKLRHAIIDNIEEWEQIVNSPQMLLTYPGWCSDMLKTAPKGWPRGHAQEFYLRMTNYGKFHPCDERFFLDSSWPDRVADMFLILKPLCDFLNYSIDE